MTDTRPLTSDEHAALRAYALEHGRDWKAALRDDWMNAKTTGTLQALRNSHGPSWLENYSIADWPRSLCSAEIALDQTPAPRLAGLSCRKLIAAFVEAEGSVKWEELEDACALAVEAFGLPNDLLQSQRRWHRPIEGKPAPFPSNSPSRHDLALRDGVLDWKGYAN